MRFVLAAALLFAGCATREPLPVYGEISPFALTAHTGEAVTLDDLRGRVWVADFIFTNCAGPCPRMSALMRQVQELVQTVDGVSLISFTVDPDRDTPEVLTEYARRFQAREPLWRFLTGDRQTLHELKLESFKLGNVDGSLNHSTRFVLIDAQGRIRGYYGTETSSPVREVVAAIKQLLEEQPS
ncbi:MAG: SCO family protein [Bryobacterales bacterium]|nr:SCO family protein [Bryobacterales bacterium]